MRLGIVVLVAGVLLLVTSRFERALVPAETPRLAAGLAALGLGTITHARGGLRWEIASIVFGVIAVALLLAVMRAYLKR